MTSHSASTSQTDHAIGGLLFKALLLAGVVIGMLGLFAPSAPGDVWFSIAAHTQRIAPPVLPGFVSAVLAIAVLTLLMTGISAFPRIFMSGGQGFAYFAAARVMAFIAALFALCFGAFRLGWMSGAVAGLLLFLLLIGAGFAFFLLGRANSPLVAELRKDLFDFYSVYVLKPLEEDQVRQQEVFSEFMHRPNAPLVIALSFLAPALIALAGIVAAAMVLQFGYGVYAGVLRHAPLIADFNAGGFSLSPVEIFRSLLIGAWHVPALAAAVVYLVVRRVSGQLIGRGHPIIIDGGMRVFDLMLKLAVLLLLVYTLLVSAGPPAGLWQGERYGLLALLVIFGVAALAVRAGWRLVRRAIAIQHALRYRRFWIDTYFILKHFPQPKNPVGYVVISTQNCVYTIASTLLVLCRLRQMGWALIVMDEWPIETERTGNKQIDRFFKVKLGYQTALNFDWHIDWKAGKVEAAGMNFFHPIWEGLSRHFGRYTLDIPEGSEAEQIFKSILQEADSTLLWAFRLQNTLAGYGKPVRIVGASAQFIPNAIWNIFCREVGVKRDMHFVWVQQGYQTYYADKAKLSKRITLDNMTRKWPYSNPYLPAKQDFDAWVARGQDVEKITERAVAWTKSNRATELKDMIQPAREVMERITAHRAAGKAVVCILGKMVFDLSTPYERGPAHDGMFDWINHTMEVAAKSPDVLYIIKPHPYEARPDIAGNVNQYFTDMIEQSIPQNVVILAHNWFNLHALFPHIDLGVLWNGTSGLELGLHGIPCIICSDWGPIDYPVGLAHPKDRADYERMMSQPKTVVMPTDFTQKCALLLEYTASDELMIRYDYVARPITNEPFGPPYWYKDQVAKFIKDGDPNIDLATKRFL